MKVGFIGLGNMGMPMARNVLASGHQVRAYNRTIARAQELATYGAQVAATPAEAAQDAEVVVTMLSDDAALEEVVFGPEGILGAMGAGAVHLSMSTIGVATARRVSQAHAERGQGYVAGPVFGRPEAAGARSLWIVVSGAPEHVERCRPLLEAMGAGYTDAGPDPAAAHLVKIAGNLLIAAAIEAVGEAIALVRRHGIDPGLLMEVVAERVFRSPIYANYGRIALEGRFRPAGFKLRHGLKDIRLALQAGEEKTLPLPIASLLRDRLLAALDRGWGEDDWASIVGLNEPGDGRGHPPLAGRSAHDR
ncbi:MAG TPA: NAD(P)-dependent oxidoreductase [Dehalococcoidia bacterium]|nr:NAD(P)-dependent oxidoreductase [Dehalococcoidia bacterium]